MQSISQIDEAELETLVLRSQDGDSVAFGRLYDALYGKVYAYAYKRTFDQSAAQDIAANSFYHMLTHIASFKWRDAARFYAWIFRIVMNEIASYYRKDKKYTLREDWLEFSEEVRDDHELVDSQTDAEARVQALKKCLQQLPGTLREPVELYYFAEVSHDVIARTLGISSGAARVRVHRGVQQLERLMKGEGYEY